MPITPPPNPWTVGRKRLGSGEGTTWRINTAESGTARAGSLRHVLPETQSQTQPGGQDIFRRRGRFQHCLQRARDTRLADEEQRQRQRGLPRNLREVGGGLGAREDGAGAGAAGLGELPRRGGRRGEPGKGSVHRRTPLPTHTPPDLGSPLAPAPTGRPSHHG